MSDRYEMVNDLCPIARNIGDMVSVGLLVDKLIELGYVKQHRGTWIDLGDQRCQCSECGAVRYGNSKACIIEYHLAPFCEKCGALLCDLTSE